MMCPCIPDRIGIWQCWFFQERGKPEMNLSEQGENQQQNQPTCDAGTGNPTPGHIGGRRVLSPLRHPCFTSWVKSNYLNEMEKWILAPIRTNVQMYTSGIFISFIDSFTWEHDLPPMVQFQVKTLNTRVEFLEARSKCVMKHAENVIYCNGHFETRRLFGRKRLIKSIRPCHTAAILSRETKKALFYQAQPHPHGFHCEDWRGKTKLFWSPGTIWPPCDKGE